MIFLSSVCKVEDHREQSLTIVSFGLQDMLGCGECGDESVARAGKRPIGDRWPTADRQRNHVTFEYKEIGRRKREEVATECRELFQVRCLAVRQGLKSSPFSDLSRETIAMHDVLRYVGYDIRNSHSGGVE